jgi:hypothetical protein
MRMTEAPIIPRPARRLFALLLAMSAVPACSSRGPSDVVPLAGSVWGTEQPAAATNALPKHSAAELAAADCTNDFNCDDVNPCTWDRCSAGKCVHQRAPGANCERGLNSGCLGKGNCVQAQVCWGGRCPKPWH